MKVVWLMVGKVMAIVMILTTIVDVPGTVETVVVVMSKKITVTLVSVLIPIHHQILHPHLPQVLHQNVHQNFLHGLAMPFAMMRTIIKNVNGMEETVVETMLTQITV